MFKTTKWGQTNGSKVDLRSTFILPIYLLPSCFKMFQDYIKRTLVTDMESGASAELKCSVWGPC